MSRIGILWEKAEDVFAANIHDLLSKAEDPVKSFNWMLEQMRRFRDDQVLKIGLAITAKEEVEGDLAKARADLEKYTGRAKKEQSAGKVEAARDAASLAVNATKLVATLTAGLANAQSTEDELKQALLSLDQKIDELESQRHLLAARAKGAEAMKSILGPINKGTRAPRADEVAARAEDQVSHMEAEARAAAEVSKLGTPQTAAGRLAHSEHQEEVDNFLASLDEKK